MRRANVCVSGGGWAEGVATYLFVQQFVAAPDPLYNACRAADGRGGGALLLLLRHSAA